MLISVVVFSFLFLIDGAQLQYLGIRKVQAGLGVSDTSCFSVMSIIGLIQVYSAIVGQENILITYKIWGVWTWL